MKKRKEYIWGMEAVLTAVVVLGRLMISQCLGTKVMSNYSD